MAVTKKAGIRVVSRFHPIEEDAPEAFLYFAEMMDVMTGGEPAGAEFFSDIDGDGGEPGGDIDPRVRRAACEMVDAARGALEDVDDKYEIYTEGELICGGGRLEVRYREPDELTGMGDTVTSISFEEERRGIVTVTRGGDVYSALVLERGVRHSCAYSTEPLPLVVYTTARRIDNGITENGGTLDMIYTVEARAGEAQYNRVTLTVTVGEEEICPK